jgi:hypothetical protein
VAIGHPRPRRAQPVASRERPVFASVYNLGGAVEAGVDPARSRC